MRFDEMAKIEDEIFKQIREIRETKGREYATDEDTLADFKEVAAETGVTPLQAWAVYTKKHLRAIDTFVREGSIKSESVRGRVLDVIVYHLLLLGLVEDLASDQRPDHRVKITDCAIHYCPSTAVETAANPRDDDSDSWPISFRPGDET